MNRTENWIKNFIKCIPLTLTGVILFVLSHPSFIFSKGLFFLAFFIYIPVLISVHKATLKTVWLQGFIFGALSYGLYAYWIIKAYSEFMPVVYIGYGILYSILFLLLKLIDIYFGKNNWVTQWLLICSFEFIKTFGFLGLSYGVTAYSQYRNTYFIQICDITGVYGLNAFIILFSAIIYSFIQKAMDRNLFIKDSENISKNKSSNLSKYLQNEKLNKSFSKKTTSVALVIWFIGFAGIYFYGFRAVKDYSGFEQKTVAAIQNNENSWLDGIEVYTKNIQKLISLTNEALEINPDIDLVVWPETAVVPAITDNYFNPKDKRRNDIVSVLLKFMDSKKCDFIIGNGHKVYNQKGDAELYNSALHFIPSQNIIPPSPQVYSKIKLVPFSEYFPYKKQFPWIYKKLKSKGLLNWEEGKEYSTFYINGLNASSLICFEDTFTDIARKQYQAGSRCLICISNDSWAKSSACQNQHLSIALFRSIENRIPSVRSTATGATCIIDPNGKINITSPEFCESYVIGKVPVISAGRKATVYSRYGDVAGWGEICALVLLLIIQTINCIINYKKSGKVKLITR